MKKKFYKRTTPPGPTTHAEAFGEDAFARDDRHREFDDRVAARDADKARQTQQKTVVPPEVKPVVPVVRSRQTRRQRSIHLAARSLFGRTNKSQ